MREFALLLWILGLLFSATNAVAHTFSAELSPKIISFSKEEGDYKVTVSGTVDKHVKLVAKVKGPVRSYKVVEKEKQYGIWMSSPAKFVRNVNSYCQVFAVGDVERLVSSNSLRGLENYNGDFLCGNTPRVLESAVIGKLNRLGLYTIEIKPIELINDTSYVFRFDMPVTSLEGDYEVDLWGFSESEEELVAHKKLKFIVKKKSQIERIKVLAGEYPVLYTVMVILLALIAGTLGGCIIGCQVINGVKKH